MQLRLRGSCFARDSSLKKPPSGNLRFFKRRSGVLGNYSASAMRQTGSHSRNQKDSFNETRSEIPAGIFECSRFCSGQSTREPRGTISIRARMVNSSITGTYFQSISTGFHSRYDQVWEQRAAVPIPPPRPSNTSTITPNPYRASGALR